LEESIFKKWQAAWKLLKNTPGKRHADSGLESGAGQSSPRKKASPLMRLSPLPSA